MDLKDLGKFGRMSVLTWPILVGALVLASCGNDATGGATASTINLDATNYIVKEPVTTTIAPLSVVEETSTGSQTYVVQSGDYAIKIAEKFGVPLEDLLNFNGWATGSEFPFPGEEIKIPPGGTAQEGAAADAAPPHQQARRSRMPVQIAHPVRTRSKPVTPPAPRSPTNLMSRLRHLTRRTPEQAATRRFTPA